MFGPHVHRSFAPRPPGGKGRPALLDHLIAARESASRAGFRMKAAQVFVAGPQSLKTALTDEEASQLRDYLAEEPQSADSRSFAVVAHGTYMDVPWKENPYTRKFIRDELRLCEAAGITGLVVHLRPTPPAEVVASLPHLVEPLAPRVTVYLETPACRPEKSLYGTPQQLADLFRRIRGGVDPRLCRFGLCVDTAHLWSCGVDLGSRADAEAWLAGLEAARDIIPPDCLMFHLNDNYAELGSGGDRHAPLLGGKIWGEYAGRPQDSGLAAFVEYAERWDILTILERNDASAPEKRAAAKAGERIMAALVGDYNVIHGLAESVRAIETRPRGSS